MFCTKCGNENKDGALFCTKCGARMMPAAQLQKKRNMQKQERKKGKSGKTILLFIACILFAVAIGLLIAFLVTDLGSFQSDKNDNHSSRIVKNDSKENKNAEENQGDDKESLEVVTEAATESEQEEDISLSPDEYAAICKDMSKLGSMDVSNEELIKNMSFAALQMEYAAKEKAKNDKTYQKVYTNLRSEDKKCLDLELLNNFYYAGNVRRLYRIETQETTESGTLYRKEGILKLVKDFYGGTSVDWDDTLGMEDWDEDHILWNMGDGEPWYCFPSCEVKENEDYEILEGCVFYGDNSGEEHFVGYGTYLFKKNPDSKLGVTLVYSEFEQKKNTNLAVSAKASSTLAGQVGKTYQASHLLDGNLNTCWVEGVKGTGEGETVTLDLGKKQRVYGIMISNGYLESKYLYQMNGKVQKLKMSGVDGLSKTHEFYIPEFEAVKESFDEYEIESMTHFITFDHPIMTDKLVITILDAVKGEKWEDTCISEIRVF